MGATPYKLRTRSTGCYGGDLPGGVSMAEMHGFARWWVDRRTEARARRTLARLGPGLGVPPSARILELGSGGGGMLALLHERYRPARLVGTDFDPVQVAAIRTFLTARWGAVPESVEVRAADALAVPFPDGSFDVVFALMMLHHVEAHHREFVQRPRALAEIRRLLAPGGRLVYSEIFGRREIPPELERLGFVAEWVHSGWRRDLAVYRRGDPPAGAAPPGPSGGEGT